MSAAVWRRRVIRRVALRALPVVLLFGLAGTLTAALEVREIRVTGTQAFPASDVERALKAALGSSTVATRAEELRARVLALPWVAEAEVRVSLDGVVTCSVIERAPAAVMVDGATHLLVDQSGTVLGHAAGPADLLQLVGYERHAAERAGLLNAVPALEREWGARLLRADRTGPHDARLFYDGAPCPVLADPGNAGALASARAVLGAWTTATGAAPGRLDARVGGRVAVLPSPPEPV